jgi:ABC-2 type transport system permease protein
MSSLRLYLAVARRAFQRATTYRSAYIAGILTNAFFGALLSFVYRAVYGDRDTVAGLSLNDAISYVWTTQSLIAIGAAWITSLEISQAIRTGDVITDLMRPWSFFLYWLSRSVGERLFNLFVRGSLTYLIGVLYFGARLPAPADLLAFGPAILLAIVVSFAISFCVNLTAFWLIDNSGVVLLVNVIIQFFSGFLMPIVFFPPALQTIARALPFQAMTGLPTQIFLGQLPPNQVGPTLLLQLGWAVALIALSLLLQQAALRKVVVQGG